MSVFQECNWPVGGTDYSKGERAALICVSVLPSPRLISHITDDKT